MFGGGGTVCLVVFVSSTAGIMPSSASWAACGGPGEEELRNERMVLPQAPHPHFKLLEATDGSSLGWGENNFESYLR